MAEDGEAATATIRRAAVLTLSPTAVYSQRRWLPTVPQNTFPVVMPMEMRCEPGGGEAAAAPDADAAAAAACCSCAVLSAANLSTISSAALQPLSGLAQSACSPNSRIMTVPLSSVMSCLMSPLCLKQTSMQRLTTAWKACRLCARTPASAESKSCSGSRMNSVVTRLNSASQARCPASTRATTADGT